MLILPEGWHKTTISASTFGDQLAIGASVVALLLAMEQRSEGFGLFHSNLSRPVKTGREGEFGGDLPPWVGKRPRSSVNLQESLSL
jgi:hypothetical protein